MGILDAALDPQFRSDVGRGLLDVANRGVAGLLGGPVDVAALALKPLGYSHPAPIGGSEWIGNLMEQSGMVSPERRPTAEFLASLLTPSVGTGGAKAVGLLSEMSPEVVGSAGRAGPLSMGYQLGAISPEGKARLLADLQAGKGSGTYRLGDVTEGQAKQLQRAGLKSTSTDVRMTDDVLRHLHDKRVLLEGFTPEEVVRLADQAMAKRSRVDFDPGKARQYPSLLNEGLLDSVTGRRYDARMPLDGLGDAFGARSVVPDGVPPRKK
jgi:hypothetical protein